MVISKALFLIAAATLLVSACGSSRRATPLGNGVLQANGLTLEVDIGSCNGQPSVSVIEEDDRVVITAQANHDNTNTCADAARIELAKPLGDRQVVDGVTGRVLKITRRSS